MSPPYIPIIHMFIVAPLLLYIGYNIYAASVAQASALGAAVSIHEKWNDLALPQTLIYAVKSSAN